MKKILQFFLLLVLSVSGFCQDIKLVSSVSGQPLSGVTVLSERGDVLAISDVEGTILKSALEPLQGTYVLIYENYEIARVGAADLSQQVIRLQDRVSEIPAVVISAKKSKYLNVKGYFNVYITINRELNVYADGVATYIFDNDSKKLRSVSIEQYRTFTKSTENQDRKKVASMVYTSSLKVPELDEIGKIQQKLQKGKSKYKELESGNQTRMQIHQTALQERAFSILGYRFYDFEYLNAASFEKGTSDLKNFLAYAEQINFKLKHKSEPDYHQMTKYANFLPTEISYSNSINSTQIKLDPDKSHYSEAYWKETGFPDMQQVFRSFFEKSLHEGPNRGTK